MFTNAEVSKAILNVDVNVIKQALKEKSLSLGLRFDFTDKSYDTFYITSQASVWHLAVVNKKPKNLELLQALLEYYHHSSFNLENTLNIVDFYSLTPIHWAVRYSNLHAIELLVYYGADPTIESRKGTPLLDTIKQSCNNQFIYKMKKILDDYAKGIKTQPSLKLNPIILQEDIVLPPPLPTRLDRFRRTINEILSSCSFHSQTNKYQLIDNVHTTAVSPTAETDKLNLKKNN